MAVRSAAPGIDSAVRPLLQKSGFLIDAAGNGLLLPGRAAASHVLVKHVGSHGAYTPVPAHCRVKMRDRSQDAAAAMRSICW